MIFTDLFLWVWNITVAISSSTWSFFLSLFFFFFSCHFASVDFTLLNRPSEIPASEITFYCSSYYFSDDHHLLFILFSFLLPLIFIMDPSLAPFWLLHPQGFIDFSQVQGHLWVWSAPSGNQLLPSYSTWNSIPLYRVILNWATAHQFSP